MVNGTHPLCSNSPFLYNQLIQKPLLFNFCQIPAVLTGTSRSSPNHVARQGLRKPCASANVFVPHPTLGR
jgi:hypothetical protein